LESLLWNTANDAFGTNYSTTVFNCLKWIRDVDPTTLQCANGMFRLFGDNSAVQWNVADFEAFKSQAFLLWDNWNIE